MEEKKEFHWITCKSWNGYFKDLDIKSDTVNEKNMQNCIYDGSFVNNVALICQPP